MQQPIEHRAHSGDIAEQLAPVFNRSIGGKQRAATFVAAHDDLQEILSRGVRQLAHPGGFCRALKKRDSIRQFADCR